jgi:hypothetical protein
VDAELKRQRLAEALESAVETAEVTQAAWGVDDCVLWCANVLKEALDFDPVSGIRGKYDSQETAHALIGKQGLAAGLRYRAKKFGWVRIAPERAKIGDLGILKDFATGTQTCVLKFKGRFWAARGWAGIVLIPEDKISSAWSVA